MKRIPCLFICFLIVFGGSACKSGLVTMNNRCYNSIEKGRLENAVGNYSAALDIFNKVLATCKAFDAKEQGNAGKATALNGLKRYEEALAAVADGLKYKNNSIDLLFEKAMAELGLGQVPEAKADLLAITDLTHKNQHTAQRAGIYAKMAEIDIRQRTYGNAVSNAGQAILLDPQNATYYMLLGDVYSAQKEFDKAREQYELAIQKGKDDAEAWKAKLTALVNATQKKYQTTHTDLLVRKMTSEEKESLCREIKTGKAKGVKDINIDLLQIAICP